jgi:hypothetical protein
MLAQCQRDHQQWLLTLDLMALSSGVGILGWTTRMEELEPERHKELNDAVSNGQHF